MNRETLQLLNAIQVPSLKGSYELMLEKTIKHGFILSPEVAAIADDALIKEISQVIGISGEKANSAFHKSWKIIQDTPQEELVLQQIVHYITTYGFEALGIYSEDAVYIPNEKLDIPEITDDIRLVVVKGLVKEQIFNEILKLDNSGIALGEDTLKAILAIVEYNEYPCFVQDVKNRELRSLLYDYYDVVPSEPVEFLRFVVSRITGESLLIKNKDLIDKIKQADSRLCRRTLDKALKQAPANLAQIFFRFKPIFLALKTVSRNKTFFNQLRKKAESQHVPMPEDYLNSVTAKLKSGKRVYLKKLEEELDKVNIFRKIRLANALSFRLQGSNSIVYRVRNGKGFASNFSFSEQDKTTRVLNLVTESIAKSLDVKGQVFYIPEFVNYALPATEKQFTGNFPTGTYITVPEDMIVGIHWFNVNRQRIDLDLATISASGKTGWDSYYTSDDYRILFSGDVTSAPKPKGASELFYIKKGITEDSIMTVNYYNFCKDIPVETTILVAHAKPKDFKSNYMVDPNKILASTKINIDRQQNILGLIKTVDSENRFYFANANIGKSITSGRGTLVNQAREYFVNMTYSSLDLRNVLETAKAKVVTEKPEEGDFIDLSPEAIDKTTIINLLTNS